MKRAILLVLSSFLLTIGLTGCPQNQTPSGTRGQINVIFSNPSGTPIISLEPFSGGVLTGTSSNMTIFAAEVAGRKVLIQFVPGLTADRTCQTTSGCNFTVGKQGAAVSAKNGTITAIISGGNVNITANGTFTQLDGGSFNGQLTATIPFIQ